MQQTLLETPFRTRKIRTFMEMLPVKKKHGRLLLRRSTFAAGVQVVYCILAEVFLHFACI